MECAKPNEQRITLCVSESFGCRLDGMQSAPNSQLAYSYNLTWPDD